MHFWIDKRSQTYGFGRARVAASLSGAGGNGLGFPHPPRRIGGKTSSMPTIHRLPPQQQQHSHSHGHHQQQQQQHQQHQQQQQSTTIDCHRSHSNSNNNNNNAHSSNHGHNNNNHHINNNSSSGVANNNNNNNNNNYTNNSSGSGTIVHYSTNRTNRACRNSSSLNNAALNNNNHHEAGATTMTTTTTRTYHHHPQFGNMSIRHYQTQQTAATGADHSSYATRVHHHHHHNPTQRIQSLASPASTLTSIALPPIYVSPSHPQSLEEGAMGIGPISSVRLHQSNTTGTVTRTTTNNSTASNSMIGSADAQVVPSHMKFGMWITLIMASIFIAGAKLYADHQGTGLEVLIFAAFSATFFLAACTVSLCRLPSSLAASPSLSIDDSSRGLLNQQNNQLNLHYQPAQQQQRENLELTPTGAPPPYHIAILLPENGKEPQFKDESPPPSYDKIVI